MTTLEKLFAFANKHSLILQQKGECGFGRSCVGFLSKSGNYLDYNPIRMSGNYESIYPYDDRLCAPAGVDAYHKHDCFAVLVENDNYETALEQLAQWIESIENKGEVEIVEFDQKPDNPISAMLHGVTGYALKFKHPKEQAA